MSDWEKCIHEICTITRDTKEPDNRSVNANYRKNRPQNMRKPGYAVLWLMCGVKDGVKTVLQIGINKSLERMFKNDLNFDRRYIIKGLRSADDSNDEKKPTSRPKSYKKAGADLRKNKYDSLIFYELDINEYLKDDYVLKYLLAPGSPQDEKLTEVYYYITASYAEGKLARETKAEYWNPSGGIDGDVYDYYRSSAPADSSAGRNS